MEKDKGKSKDSKFVSKAEKKSRKKMFGKWREKLEDKDSSSASAAEWESLQLSTAVLGVSVEKALERSPSHDGVSVPAIVRCCIDYVEKNGLHVEGIYRLSCPKSQLDDLEAAWNAGQQPPFDDPHQATGLLKRFFRQLASPLFPNLSTLESLAEHCNCVPITACRCPVSRAVKNALSDLPEENFLLAAYLFVHAQHVIEKERENKMGLAALGVLLQTVLGLSKRLVCILLLNASDNLPLIEPETILFFNDVHLQPYEPPKSAAQLGEWKTDSKVELSAELVKQESLLRFLHAQIAELRESGASTKTKEEELWTLQTAITGLKRSLKSLDTTEETDERRAERREKPNKAVFEEKQLLATQVRLREELGEEKAKIARLCWEGAVGVASGWGPETEEEVLKRARLVKDISLLRTHCALLRAQIEIQSLSGGTVETTRF